MGPDLMGPACERLREDADTAVRTPADGQPRARRAPLADHDAPALPLPDREVHNLFVVQGAHHHRKVLLADGARLKCALERTFPLGRARQHEAPRCLHVQAMARRQPRDLRHGQGAPGHGGHRDSARFVDNLDMTVRMQRQQEPLAVVSPIQPLALEQLRWQVPPGILGFSTTSELQPVEDILGQPHAQAALRRGVLLEAPGFNVFVVGLLATGRLGTVERILRGLRPRRRSGRDFVYVANFSNPARPQLLELPAARGAVFRKELLRVAGELAEQIPRVLRSEAVRTQRERRAQSAEVAHHGALQRLEAHAKELGFVVADMGEDGALNPVILWLEASAVAEDAPVHTRAEVQVLAESGELHLPLPLEEVLSRFDRLEAELAGAVNLSREAMLDTVRHAAETERAAVRTAAAEVLAALAKRWPRARAWLAELTEALGDSPEWFDEDGDHDDLVGAFTANVVHAGSRSVNAPIVVVPNPTWSLLFGGVEGEGGVDHRSIRSGALQDADGGFLVLSAADLLQDAAAWRHLKRVLMFGQVDVQNPESPLTAGAPVLRPDPMGLDVKVVLLGDSDTYATLFYGDPDFQSLFKIKAEFEEDAVITPELLSEYARFVARVLAKERLPAFSREAVEAVLEWAVRDAGRGGRITTHFGTVADLVREASFEAGRRVVARGDVESALRARRDRDDHPERRVMEMLEAGVLRLDLAGQAIGRVNALVVYHVGGHDFGRPMRITAAVGVGRRGVVSIEREAKLSGKMHQKAVQILRGFLLQTFGRRRPLSFTASLCFEQSYSRVDGDSAGLAELSVLLSAVARVPLRQDIAVTGSINQLGEVQGVGGVNEKIEGFYAACALRGLTGTQGVVLPRSNVRDLCLSRAVCEACASGAFHVWAVDTVDEALRLLTGLEVGLAGDATDTLLGRVEQGLTELALAGRRAALP